jgi:hypothetical protein
MWSGNKIFMQTIFEVSIQPAAGYLVNCHVSIHTHQILKNFIVIIRSKSSVTCCLHLQMLTVEWHTQTIWGTCITVAMSQSYIDDHWIAENVLKVMREVYNSIPILCTHYTDTVRFKLHSISTQKQFVL